MNKPYATALYDRKISSCVELTCKTVFRIHPVSFPGNLPGRANTYFFVLVELTLPERRAKPSTMQFISRELRPFWKATCAISLWCNKNFNVGILHTRLNQFFSQTWNALFLFQTFLRFLKLRLYSHNMLISQGDADIIELGRARIHRTRKHERITVLRNCLTDQNLHFECPSGSNDDYDCKIVSLR